MQNLFSYVFQCKWHTRPYRSNDTVNTCFHCWNVNLVLIAFCPYIQWSSYDFFSSFWSFPSVSIFSSFYHMYYNHCNALQGFLALQEPFLFAHTQLISLVKVTSVQHVVLNTSFLEGNLLLNYLQYFVLFVFWSSFSIQKFFISAALAR